MKISHIEMLKRTGYNQYAELLCPRTTSSNVISSSNINLDNELYNLKTIIEQAPVISTSEYIITSNDIVEVEINNPSYVYLISGLEVFHNGLLMIEGMHYEITPNKKIKLIQYSADLDDEFVFKVYNYMLSNIDMSYIDLPTEISVAQSELIESINSYSSDVNRFKNDIITHLNSIGYNLDLTNSYDEIVEIIKDRLTEISGFPSDLGVVIGKPYYDYDISFNLGYLFGIENDVSYFNNDLGSLF